MKRCPTCQSIYTDDSLAFCLQDGSMLLLTTSSATSDVVVPAPLDPDATLRGAKTSSSEAPLTETLDPRAAPTAEIQLHGSTAATQFQPLSQSRAVEGEIAKAASSKRALKWGLISVAALVLVLAGIGIASLIRGDRDSRKGARIWGDRRGAAENINRFSAPPNNTSAATSSTGTQPSPTPTLSAVTVTVTASSTRANYKGNTYVPGNARDGDLQTAWAEGAPGPGIGEWLRCDFNREVNLRQIMIAPGYFKNKAIWARNNRLSSATIFFSDGSSRKFSFPNAMKKQTLDLGTVKTSWVKVVIKDVYPGADPDTPISELAFDWEP